MTEPELDVILVTHNHLELTIKSLDCLYNYTEPEVFKLAIVDDSIDETVPYLRRFVKERNNVQVLTPTRKITCTNHAINIALKKTTLPVICYLGNSTFVEPHWLDSAYKLITQREDCGIVGFKILNPHGTIQSTGIMGIFANGMMKANGKDAAGHRCTYISQVPCIGGCLFLIRREAIKTLKGGKLDDTTYYGFRGWDDLDMCLSIRKAGWDVIYCGYGSAYHVDSPTKKEHSDEDNFWAELEENKKIFLAKWGYNLEF